MARAEKARRKSLSAALGRVHFTESTNSACRGGGPMSTTTDYTINSLPANVEAERSILGGIILDANAYDQLLWAGTNGDAPYPSTRDGRNRRTH